MFSREIRKERVSAIRRTISKKLAQASNTLALASVFDEVNMQGIRDIQDRYNELFKEKYKLHLGITSFFVGAACIALREFPIINARLVNESEILFREYCDISIAIACRYGLVTPVLSNAERLSLPEIERQIFKLAITANRNKLTAEQTKAGTFTITNGGVFGSLMSTPIVNLPQSAIIGMHNIVEKPIAINGVLFPRPIMRVAVTFNQQIIEEEEAICFLIRVKQLLESPDLIFS